MNNEMQLLNGQGFTPQQIEMLEQPLDAALIRQRPDGKKFLKGSTEFDTANRIFGYGKWGFRVISRELRKSYDLEDKVTGMYYYVEIELFVAGAMFPMHGDGGQTVKYYTPQGFEDASKGATTDAVKRALKNYGNQFGLPLYDEDALVDSGEGVMVKVKEVKVSKRVIDSPRQQQPRQISQPPTAEDLKKKRLNDLFKAGKEKGLFLTKEDMAKYIGGILKTTIGPDGIANLLDEELVLLESMVASAVVEPVQQQAPKQEQAEVKQEQTPEQALQARRLAIYQRAKEMRQFEVSEKATENTQAFFRFVVPIINANVTNVEHLTHSRLDAIEAYLNSKDVA